MANLFADLLSNAGSGLTNAINAPGDYFRGLLAGRPGERASGLDVLGIDSTEEPDFWKKLLGFGTELVTDPINLIGGGLLVKNWLAHARAAKSAAQANKFTPLKQLLLEGEKVGGGGLGAIPEAYKGTAMAKGGGLNLPEMISRPRQMFAPLMDPLDYAQVLGVYNVGSDRKSVV